MFRIRCVVEGRDQICFGCSGLTLQEHIQELGEGEEAWDCIITGWHEHRIIKGNYRGSGTGKGWVQEGNVLPPTQSRNFI